MSRDLQQKGTLTRRKMTTQESDTRTELRHLLTSIKDHSVTSRAQPLPRSLNLSHHLHRLEVSPNRKISFPSLTRRKSVTKIPHLRDFEKHIIGNYLNAHLKFQAQNVPVTKPRHVKRKKTKHKKQLKGKSQQKLVLGENTTINQAELTTIQDSSRYQSIENVKEYSLRDQPMKHYVQERLARKKREWKEKTPLELQTYFATVKDKIGKVSPQGHPTENKAHKDQKVKIKVPSTEMLSNFIKKYIPRNRQIRKEQLIKKQTFTVDDTGDCLYFGQVCSGKRQGQGIEIRQGYIFQGHWMNGLRIRGYQITSHGIYIGGFRNDKKEGKGQLRSSNGQTYSGEWIAGKRHGVGLWTSPKGDSYMGQWKKGVVEGQGVHKTSSGQRYQGSFKNFLKHGWGRQTFPNRDKYQGNYFQGFPHGAGIYVWADGTTYEGEFFQGYRQGEGLLRTPKGFNFRGSFVKEKATGQCEINYGNGQTYQGTVRDGKRNGKGTLRNLTKRRVFTGYWKDDEFVTQDELS